MSSSLFVLEKGLEKGNDAFLKDAKVLFDASKYEAVGPNAFSKTSTSDHTKLVTELKNLRTKLKSSVKIHHSSSTQVV